MTKPDKKLSVVGWILLSYVLASYIFWGIVVATEPTPHFGEGVLIFTWLIAPVTCLQILSHLDQVVTVLWFLVAFGGSSVLLYFWRGVDWKRKFIAHPPAQ